MKGKMSKKETGTDRSPNMQTYVCMVRPLSTQEREALKIRILHSIQELAEKH